MSYEELIDSVKLRPELWQRSHPLHKNRVLRLRFWNAISKELKTDVNQLKKNWKYLLDQYRREHKKITKSQALYEGKPLPSSWVYYDRLSFLMEEMNKRRESAKMTASSDSDTSANVSTMAQDPSQTTEAFTMDTSQQYDSNDDYENVTWTYNKEVKQKKQQGVRLAKGGSSSSRPSYSNGLTKADLILSKLQNLSSKIANSQLDRTSNDDDYMFFMSILPMVRTLTPVKKLQLRVKINEWLLQTLSGDADPLNSVEHYEVPAMDMCEDNKKAVMEQIMRAESGDA